MVELWNLQDEQGAKVLAVAKRMTARAADMYTRVRAALELPDTEDSTQFVLAADAWPTDNKAAVRELLATPDPYEDLAALSKCTAEDLDPLMFGEPVRLWFEGENK
jgi:hypothetical protein